MTSQFNVGDIVRLKDVRGEKHWTIDKNGGKCGLRRFDTRMVRWVKDDGSEIAVRISPKGSDTVDVMRIPSHYFELVRRGSPPDKPFEVGDIVRCHTRHYAGIRHGQDVRVTSMRMGTIGEWLAKFDTTGGKDYYARNFHKAPKELQTNTQEREKMFVAMRLVDNSMKATHEAVSRTDYVMLKTMGDKEALKRWVADRVAATGEHWVILYASQICKPQANVEWANL